MIATQDIAAAIDRSTGHREVTRVEWNGTVSELMSTVALLWSGDYGYDMLTTSDTGPNEIDLYGWHYDTPANDHEWRLLVIVTE